jgi:hypothetical protein
VSCVCDSLVSHGGDYERHCLLGRDVVRSFEGEGTRFIRKVGKFLPEFGASQHIGRKFIGL